MEIKDLTPKQGNVDIVVEVVEIEEPREFQKFGNAGKVANARVKDGSGDIKLTLWNEQVTQIKEGDKVHIINGYVNEWQGEKQLTTGKFGSLEVVGKEDTESKTETKEEQEVTEEETEINEEKIE